MGPPPPPPYGNLIENARKGSRLSLQRAAEKAGVSKGTWIDTVRGHKKRDDVWRPVNPKAETIAAMAGAAGLTPERLETEEWPPDAAGILREIIRQESATRAGPVAEPSPPESRYGNRTLDYLWRTPGLTEAQCEVLIGLARTWVEPSADAYEERRRA